MGCPLVGPVFSEWSWMGVLILLLLTLEWEWGAGPRSSCWLCAYFLSHPSMSGTVTGSGMRGEHPDTAPRPAGQKDMQATERCLPCAVPRLPCRPGFRLLFHLGSPLRVLACPSWTGPWSQGRPLPGTLRTPTTQECQHGPHCLHRQLGPGEPCSSVREGALPTPKFTDTVTQAPLPQGAGGRCANAPTVAEPDLTPALRVSSAPPFPDSRGAPR